jgi:signal transduction histidine kinase/CheY-like chemotaxis protein
MPSPVGRAIRGGFHVAVPAGAQLVTKLGTSKLIDDAATPIIDDRGHVLGGVAVFRDVTERRRLEERLALSERLASIGTMAAGTAHEINNPLSATLANVEFALQKLSGILQVPAGGDADTPSRIREVVEALSDAHHAGERVRKIVGELKKFARAEQASRSPLDLPDVLEAAIKLTEHQVRHSARLFRHYGTTPLIDANEGRLVQVFTNLILNAAQAVASSPSSGNEITITTRTDAAGRAEVEVRDNGPGIAQEHIGRIFDVFFTTKPTGAGTGLGLSICHSIVEDLGGELTVSSDSGNGAAFRVAIPPASGIAAPPLSAPVRLPGRRGRVLSIDDEVAVSRTVERILKDLHDVVTETDARAALARIARGERFDVILCDLMMPGMNGMDFYEAIRSADAELARRIVFVSGGVFSDRASRFLEGCTNLSLEKPFSVERLRAVVADYVA